MYEMTRRVFWSFWAFYKIIYVVKYLIEKEKRLVHYCWFGEKKLPEQYKNFIENNKKFFSGYEVIIWDENNFDITTCDFAKQAYDKRAYAFVSDYVRAKVLYEYGGIYLDTDVKVIKKFPAFDNYEGFAAFERRMFLGTAVLGFNKGNEIIGKIVQHYENRNFVLDDGDMDIVANVSLFTDIMIENGLVLGGEEQEVAGIKICPREVFYPKKLGEGDFRVTEDTVAIHYCANSWLSNREKRRGKNKFWIEIVRPLLQKIRKILQKMIGKDRTQKIEIRLRNKLK